MSIQNPTLKRRLIDNLKGTPSRPRQSSVEHGGQRESVVQTVPSKERIARERNRLAMRSAANPTTTDGYDDGGDSQSGSATGDNFNSSFNAGTTDIDSDGDGDVSDTNDRARKRRREVRDKYEGILEFDRPPAAIARTVLICRMITGETMGAYTIDPWFPLNEQGFITLATDTWNRARQELSVEVRQRVSKHASVEVVEYLRAQPLGFRTQTMLRVRRTVPSVYGLNAAEPEKTRSEVQQLLRDFAFIARDPYKPSRAQFLHKGIALVLARTLWGSSQEALARHRGASGFFETLTGTTLCYLCAMIYWTITEWSTGVLNIVSCTMTGLRSPYRSLLRQWNANSPSRRRALVEKIKAMVERYTTVALPMESYMPVARNEFANSLEDIDSDSDCEQYKTGSSTSHYMVRAKEKTPPSYSLAIQASEERRLEPSQHNHVNNVRPLLISSTKEVESETPTKGKAQKGKNKDQSKGRKANLVGEREVLLSRADGRHQAIPIKSGDTFASLRRKCLVNDDSINLWHNDTILGDHTMAKFVDTLWASKDAVHLTMQAFEHDPEDDPVIFYYTGKMNGTTDKEENGTGSQEDDTELSEPDSDVVSGLGTDHLNKTGTRRSTRGKG